MGKYGVAYKHSTMLQDVLCSGSLGHPRLRHQELNVPRKYFTVDSLVSTCLLSGSELWPQSSLLQLLWRRFPPSVKVLKGGHVLPDNLSIFPTVGRSLFAMLSSHI